jgi:ParB-like chromosome segregation protein Spo0J
MENKEIESPAENEAAANSNMPIPITPDQLASFMDSRKLSIAGRQTIKILVRKISFRPGHNVTSEESYDKEYIEQLADSIQELGLEHPITVDLMKDGTAYVLWGHGRLLAHRLLIERGAKRKGKGKDRNKEKGFEYIECFLAPKDYTEIDRTTAMILENVKRHVKPIEQAAGLLRLKEFGLSNAAISKMLPGINEMQIGLMLTLAGLSKEEQDLIADGKISPTAAVKLARKESDPAKRVEIIEKAAAGEDGKLKVTEVDNIISDQEQADNIASMMMGNAANGETGDPFANDRSDYLKINSGDSNDPSMKGNSGKAHESTQDPAIKSKDQPKPLDEDDKDDHDIVTGKATARDMIAESVEICKKLSYEIEKDLSPKGITLLFDLEKKLLDLKAILKSK